MSAGLVYAAVIPGLILAAVAIFVTAYVLVEIRPRNKRGQR